MPHKRAPLPFCGTPTHQPAHHASAPQPHSLSLQRLGVLAMTGLRFCPRNFRGEAECMGNILGQG